MNRCIITLNFVHTAERPNFSGSWILDKATSDDPKGIMRSAHRTQQTVIQ